MKLQGQSAIITGGASGLGAATARELTANGVKVTLWDLNEELGKSLATELGGAFARVDVASEDDVKAGIEVAKAAHGIPRILVNCAGIGRAERVVGKDGPHSLDSFRKTVEVNLVGTFNVVRLFAERAQRLEPLEGGERGVIVNTASVAAFDGQIGQSAYAATKGAIVAMTLPLARDLARAGIRVMTIAPGIFRTAMLGELSEEVRASLGAQVPFPPRLGEPAEYAALAAHIVENPMLNGEVIRLDGAIRMAPK